MLNKLMNEAETQFWNTKWESPKWQRRFGMSKTIELSFKDAAVISSVLEELGHPKGPFGEQHLLHTACENISSRTMIPFEELSDALIEVVHRIMKFVEGESSGEWTKIRRQAN